ncbi:MAG: DNA starvation/stationary phase protection protein [Bdellovibrionaceae bacterium]|nr:DNA starvation/stationary phase protection protein [Pseudobdellovibrionaceae bacterium]
MTKKIATQANLSEESTLLKVVLADTFVLYMKTYAVHWNYKGAKFFSVHRLTEEHYKALADAIDEIAERIRAKGDEAPFSLKDIMGSADLNEIKESDVGTDQALRDLIKSHEMLSQKAREASIALDEVDDVYSADMMTRRVGDHDKAAWMLKSFLQQ